MVIGGHVEKFESPDVSVLTEVKQEDTLLSYFFTHTGTSVFCGLFSAMFFSFSCPFWGGNRFSLFKMAPKQSVEVLSSVPKYKKSMTCHTEKICILDKLNLSMSYSAFSHEFNVNE